MNQGENGGQRYKCRRNIRMRRYERNNCAGYGVLDSVALQERAEGNKQADKDSRYIFHGRSVSKVLDNMRIAFTVEDARNSWLGDIEYQQDSYT